MNLEKFSDSWNLPSKFYTLTQGYTSTTNKSIDNSTVLAIYGPIFYTALYVMFLMRSNPLKGPLEGWAMKVKTFLGPVWAQQN